MDGDKEYIDNQIRWMKEYFDAELKSVREAVNKVERTNDTKFAGQNEFRSQLSDQAQTFATKESLDAVRGMLEKENKTQASEITQLKNVIGNLQGRIVGFGLVWTILIVLLTWFINKGIQ